MLTQTVTAIAVSLLLTMSGVSPATADPITEESTSATTTASEEEVTFTEVTPPAPNPEESLPEQPAEEPIEEPVVEEEPIVEEPSTENPTVTPPAVTNNVTEEPKPLVAETALPGVHCDLKSKRTVFVKPGSKLIFQGGMTFLKDMNGNAINRPAEIQKSNNGKWETVAKVTKLNINTELPQNCNFTIDYTYNTTTSPGTYRYLLPATTDYARATTSFTVTAMNETVNVNMKWVDPIKSASSYTNGFNAKVSIFGGTISPTPVHGTLELLKTANGKTTVVKAYTISMLASSTNKYTFQDPTFKPNDSITTFSARFIPDTAAGYPNLTYLNTTGLSAGLRYPAVVTKATETNLTGKTLSAARFNTLTLKGKLTVIKNAARPVNIQKYDAKAKKWVTVKTVTTTATGNWTYSIGKTTESSQNYRIHAPEVMGAKAYVGPNTKVNRPKTAYSISIGSITTKRQVPWDANKMSFYVNTNGTVKALTLQVKAGNGSWKKVKTVNSNKKAGTYTFNLLKGTANSATQNLYYRLMIPSDAYATTSYSKNMHVVWENPNKYTGLQKELYNYAKFACPKTFIRFAPLASTHGAWGLASLGSNISTFEPNIPAQHRRTVALHECAHHVQWNTAYLKGNGGWNSYLNKANRVQGTSGQLGMERTAECMAQMWSPNSYWGYGADCRYERYDFALRTIRGQKV